MPGKQVRISEPLYQELKEQSSTTIGKHIESLLAELKLYKSFLDRHGIDPSCKDQRIIKLSIRSWSQLNAARARYILTCPEHAYTIDQTIDMLTKRADDERQDRDVDKCSV